jgi:hypothetical protein
MNQTLWTRFLIATVLLIMAGSAIGALALPPDPISQLPGFVLAVVLAIPLAYWLVYSLSNLQSQIQN